MTYIPLKLVLQCLAQRKASYINESVIVITRKNSIYAGPHSSGESSGARVSPWGGAGSLCFITDPGDLVALVPVVIALKLSPSPASVWCFGTLSACLVVLQSTGASPGS